jgi:hypothetical protein
MEDKETTRRQDEKLTWDIGFAIWQRRVLQKNNRSIERCRSVAATAAKHSRLCGWTFDKRPTETPHRAGQTVSKDEGDSND